MERRKAREQAFILIFEKSFQLDTEIEELIEFAKENDVFEVDGFTVELVNKTYDNIDEIDGLIKEYIKGRSFQRISRVSKAVLRMAVCELLFFKGDVPVSVAINEAVEIAKIYASEEEPGYVNGVLGSIARQSGRV